MELADVAKRLERFVSNNSPSILSAVSVVGTVTTAILTGRATFKAAGVIREHTDQQTPPREKLELIWKLYIPPVASGIGTVACIIFANRIGTRRAAAMAAAYSLSERAFEEYRHKVVERLGEKKERGIQDEIAQDRVLNNPPGKTEVIVTGRGLVLCYDMYTGRYFESDIEAIRKAQNDLNQKILNDYYASLSDLYDLLGLARTTTSDEVGWNCDKLLEITFSTTMSDDGRPCIAISFRVDPIRNYYRVS
jgi:hypothetical protein